MGDSSLQISESFLRRGCLLRIEQDLMGLNVIKGDLSYTLKKKILMGRTDKQ